MANLTRRILRSYYFSPNVSSAVSGKRYLFSSEILGVENFKRIRIFERDKLCDKEGFVQKLSHSRHANIIQNKRLVPDLVKLIYIAEKESEVLLITDLLKQLYYNETDTQQTPSDELSEKLLMEGPLSPKRFQFGPLVFRLLYILKDMGTAQLLFEDKDLGALFQNTTCQLLRMDMLYEAGHYRQVLDAFTTLQHAGVSAKFPPDCTTLAIAALYQLNTAESCQEMKRLIEEAKLADCTLSRRSLLFAVMLALKQGEAQCALNIAQPVLSTNESIFRNIKIMALAELGQLEEAVKTMEDGLRDTASSSSRTCTVYSDTVQRVADHLATSSMPELEARFEGVVSRLEVEGLRSPQTVEHFVNRPILRLRKPRTSQSFKTRLKSPVKMK